MALMAALAMSIGGAAAFDDSKYPNLKGQWVRAEGARGVGRFDPTKPPGRLQEAPLTAEYQAIYEARLAEQVLGGQDYNPQVRCLQPGLPRAMIAYEPIEFIITPEVTYMRLDYMQEFRRIYTDGRERPESLAPTLLGYSIGKWIDEDGDGKFDVLEVETRHLKGPRSLDPAGMPTHEDNQSLIKERIYPSKTDPSLLHNEITLVDNAFTRPWTVLKTYRRDPDPHPYWPEYICPAENVLIKIGNETYFKAADGNLMPTRKNQPPPDFRYFNNAKK